MKTVSLLFLGFFLVSCGGDGGSGNSNTGDNSPQTSTIVCEHDGDLWLCPDGQGTCIRDQSLTETLSEVESERRFLIKEVNGVPRFYAKLDSGAITIIAECGSNVTFTNTEETSSDTVVTTATANFGVNQPAEAN